MKVQKYSNSDRRILKAVLETANDLYRLGIIDKDKLEKYNQYYLNSKNKNK